MARTQTATFIVHSIICKATDFSVFQGLLDIYVVSYSAYQAAGVFVEYLVQCDAITALFLLKKKSDSLKRDFP